MISGNYLRNRLPLKIVEQIADERDAGDEGDEPGVVLTGQKGMPGAEAFIHRVHKDQARNLPGKPVLQAAGFLLAGILNLGSYL